ncbi:hypothetical protein C8E03_111110 [Lachnotalea glycerini]|uniref:Iron-dependent peroxidase n=1 Tax=Lachnotalea glycerini TaxID=1763509 RepID=A0A255I748_9FIRM|nr:hypothetical protein [Lachnotalea glycerini]PXV86910.1 hypothetical protein C8E03_111110 [Lachnotalea glycerini]RDY30436.1 hypothetical protein CG710_014660 [Lachnotalea glycerini]
MNFLWDIVLRAQSSKKKEEDLFFTQAAECSPFYEQSFSCINENLVDENEIELNLLYRFTDIFQEILAEDGKEFCEFKKYLIDVVLHILLYTDLRHGLSIREIYIRKLTQELLNGTFWEEGAKKFQMIPLQKQKRLATLVLSQIQTGSSLLIFRRSVLILFPDAILYQVKADRKKLLLYLTDAQEDHKKSMIQFVQDMFLPLSYNIRIFWEYHFGIIGVEGTMRIDELAIY